jgi:hypothetical protein
MSVRREKTKSRKTKIKNAPKAKTTRAIAKPDPVLAYLDSETAFRTHFEKSLRERFELECFGADLYKLVVNERLAFLRLKVGPIERLDAHLADIQQDHGPNVPVVWHDLLNEFENAFSGWEYNLKCVAVGSKHSSGNDNDDDAELTAALYRFTAANRRAAFAHLKCSLFDVEEMVRGAIESAFPAVSPPSSSWRAVRKLRREEAAARA